jgi:hypothetical protein
MFLYGFVFKANFRFSVIIFCNICPFTFGVSETILNLILNIKFYFSIIRITVPMIQTVVRRIVMEMAWVMPVITMMMMMS